MAQMRHKSRIPLVRPDSKSSQTSQDDQEEPLTSRSKYNNSNSKAKQPVNPLAKAMEKRPKAKTDKHVKSSSETWYEEKVETQSQLRYQKTRTEHQKRKEDIVKQLKEAEAEVGVLKNLLDQRDKLLKDAEEESENKISTLEEQLEEKEKVLITNGIDPVTGQQILPSQEESMRTKKLEKFTKKKVQEMRDKLTNMNKETESYLADIENTMQYLGSLEVASDRLGPLSEETRKFFGDFDDEEDVIAKVYDENKAKSKDKNSKPEGETENSDVQDADEGEIEENEEAEDENKERTKTQFFITRQGSLSRASPSQ